MLRLIGLERVNSVICARDVKTIGVLGTTPIALRNC